MLLVVDDVWDSRHAQLFQIGGRRCGMLVTTRLTRVAEEITPSSAHRFNLDVLTEEEALDLLRRLAYRAVKESPEACRELVQELEGLPLAIQVAGRLLEVESRLGDRGLKVRSLLADVREGATRLLEQPVPVDMRDLLSDTIPTVAALLKRSTDALSKTLRCRFAALSLYPPRPATFDIEGLAQVWDVPLDEAADNVAELLDRGLLEPASSGRVQCHALLIAHALRIADELS